MSDADIDIDIPIIRKGRPVKSKRIKNKQTKEQQTNKNDNNHPCIILPTDELRIPVHSNHIEQSIEQKQVEINEKTTKYIVELNKQEYDLFVSFRNLVNLYNNINNIVK
jgi:hypothetical protein